MKTHAISNDHTKMSFGRNPLVGVSLKNLLTGEISCKDGTQTLLLRFPRQISEPTIFTEVTFVRHGREGLRYRLEDPTRKQNAEILVSENSDGLRFRLDVTASEPIWLVEWRLSGFDCEEVIIPALGGQSLSKQMPVETTLSYKYPFWWNAQFVIGARSKGGCWIRTMDETPDLKLLRVKREENCFALTYGFEATAPLRSRNLRAEWFVDCYRGDWSVPVDIHRRWLEKAFGPKTLETNPYFPGWAHRINFVLELWGAAKDGAQPMHTFDQMIERLRLWKKIHRPDRTLVYVPGFAGRGIDSGAPDYSPSRELGGESKFRKLVNLAHSMGYKVMIHTNVLAMTYTHRLYPSLKKHQVVDAFGRLQGWGLDIDGDWLFEPYFAYANPGAKAWGDLMEKVIGRLVRKFHVDGVFLDQTLLAFNVSKGPNFQVGMRNHIHRLQHAFPEILFAGEGLHEQVFAALPMAQIHGIDSVAEVHGIEGKAPWRKAHPVSTYLFGKHTRFVAHLLTKHPTNPMFKLQEEAYARLGVIPALCLYNHRQPLDGPVVRRMIKRANRLQFITHD